MKRVHIFIVMVCMGCFLLFSCQKEELEAEKEETITEADTEPPRNSFDSIPAKISIVSGNEQEADWEDTLKAPLVVKVTNKAGQALKNARVGWSLQSDYGTITGKLSGTQYQTDSNGIARTYYTVGKQHWQKPETIMVQAIGNNGQPIPEAAAAFTYKQKRRNFTLVQLKPEMDYFSGYSGGSVMYEWKNGDQITIMENEMMLFNIKEDGKLIKNQDGSLVWFGISTKDILVNRSEYADRTFQAKDIVLINWGILFSDPATGRTDSVVVDLTISNQLYRTFVGKTLRAEGGGIPEDGNIGEVITFKYRTDGKVEMKSLLHPSTPDIVTTYGTHDIHSYAPIYGCSVNGVMPYIMKRVIGMITSPFGPSMAYGMSASIILFADGTIRPNTMGTGFDECTYNRFWKNLTLE